MPVKTGYSILPDIYKRKSTWRCLTVLVFVIHIFSVKSMLLTLAKEEDGPVLSTDKTSYVTGENILINYSAPINTTVANLTLYDPEGNSYRFLDEQSVRDNVVTLIYSSNKAGGYKVTAELKTRNAIRIITTNFSVTGSTHEPGYLPFQVQPQVTDIAALIPKDAIDVEFFMELGDEKTLSNSLRPDLSGKANGSSVHIMQETAVINEPVGWIISKGSNMVKYRTPPAYLIEKNINNSIKKVIVGSNASVHYHNMTVFTNITEAKKDDIRLFWFDNGTQVDVTRENAYNLTFSDANADGLIDNIQWTVPKLSSQTFEISTGITVINVQSYPTLGGNWTVRFNTSGMADLTVTPVNGTGFGKDLEFLELWCGSTEVNATYNGTSVFYPDWNCKDEGKIVDRVISTGKHTLEFRFGSAVELAYNLVDSDLLLTPENITFVYSAGQQSEVTETGEAKEGINLTINTTIYNQGVSESGPFSLLFYDGGMEFYNVSIVNISAGGSANATAYWTTLAGTHNITIRADPYNDTQDSERGNNNASKLINVSAWQKYYGNISGNIVLAASATINLTGWGWSNTSSSGYICIVKKSASIDWNSLWALGYRKDSTAKGTTDFLDADNALGIRPSVDNATDFTNNNITSLFSSDGTNATATLNNIVIQGKTIDGVPVANSTNMTNTTNITGADFITGILWDTSDAAGDEYTGAEDLVFIAKIKSANTGMVNVHHDYEIAVPNAIRAAVGGEVEFYEELR